MLHGKKIRGGLSRGGCPGGVVRILAGLSKGLSGLRRFASACTCHNHPYHQKYGTASQAQLELAHLVHPSLLSVPPFSCPSSRSLRAPSFTDLSTTTVLTGVLMR